MSNYRAVRPYITAQGTPHRLSQQPDLPLSPAAASGQQLAIVVDPRVRYQEIEGFGAADFADQRFDTTWDVNDVALAEIATDVGGFDVDPFMSSWFIPCVGASIATGGSKLPTPNGARRTRSLWLTADRQPDDTATAIFGDIWFSSEAIASDNPSFRRRQRGCGGLPQDRRRVERQHRALDPDHQRAARPGALLPADQRRRPQQRRLDHDSERRRQLRQPVLDPARRQVRAHRYRSMGFVLQHDR